MKKQTVQNQVASNVHRLICGVIEILKCMGVAKVSETSSSLNTRSPTTHQGHGPEANAKMYSLQLKFSLLTLPAAEIFLCSTN